MRSGEDGMTGCTFSIDLPVTHIRQEPERRLSNVEKLAQACGIAMDQLAICRPRVLVVDDSALNRKMVVRVLTEHCEICSEAANGQLALDLIIESMQPDNIGYDGIIMDFLMPVMTGPDAVRKLRACGFKGSIVGLTGNCFKDDVQAFLDAGAGKVLFKPIGFNQLRDIIPGS